MSTYLPGRLSSTVGLLITLALLAGMLVIGPEAIKAQTRDPEPDYRATFDACPEDVISDDWFADVSPRHDNANDINCIAYYGITKGKTPITYAPDEPVIREHMALFLIRMAMRVGIDVPGAGSAAFRDIGHLSKESQDAISQLAQLGITVGAGNNNYKPRDNVTRGEMALFLSRLMNLMDVPEHRGEVFGYLPDDVENRVLDEADVDAPYNDMRQRTVEEFVAVEQLYELGVASGVSSRAYGPARDMSRAHMAEFMAAILDHSNLRPEGVTVQLTPRLGWEDYPITVMISARTADFAPLDNERVDWFYTDDPDGGLQASGECNQDVLIEGDCVWDDDRDDLTDDNGNYFEDIRASAGEVLTFYAWMGRRDGDEFDEDTERPGVAEASSDKGPTSFVITSNIAENAGRINDETSRLDGAWIVDRDVQRSVRLTIQLEDDDGRILNRQGLEIAVDVEEWDGEVATANVNDEMVPQPTFPDPSGAPTRRDDDETILTNQRGEATYLLSRPRGEGATLVTFSYEGVDDNTEFAVVWSEDNPVVFNAKPDFDTYQSRSSSRIVFGIDYDLYDQYGKRLTRRTNNIGRDGTLQHTLSYKVYKVEPDGRKATPTDSEELTMTMSTNGRISYNINTANTDQIKDLDMAGDEDGTNYVVVLTPSIQTGGTGGDPVVKYADGSAVVWIVMEANDETDLDKYQGDYDAFLSTIESVDNNEDFTKITVDAGRDEFRTYFTIWEYDSNDDFVDIDDNDLTITQFENLLKDDVEVDELDIRLYSRSSARLSYFIVKR